MAVNGHQTAIRDAVTRLEQELVATRQLGPGGLGFGGLRFGFFGFWFFGLGLGFGGLRFGFFGLGFAGFRFFGLWRFLGRRFWNGGLDQRRRSGRSRCGGSLWVGRDSARLEGL